MAVLHEPAPEHEARRALVLDDRQLVVDLIELTLNHGLFVVRAADNLAEAEAILAGWHPDMTVIDMDHDDSDGAPPPARGHEHDAANRDPGSWPDSSWRSADEASGVRPRRR